MNSVEFPDSTDMSSDAQEWLKTLGNFAPHVDEDNNQEFLMLGHAIEKIDDGDYFSSRWYMSANDWRDLAGACQEVADWLEANR